MSAPFSLRYLCFFAVACALPLSAAAQNPAASIAVDVTANRKPIDPRIYGLAHADAAMLNDLNVPLNRSGGNNTTRYNWQLNADNRAFDWYFQSLPYSSAVAGEGGDSFIAASRAGGAQPMITIPLIGWVAKLGPNRGRLSSFSIAKYGAQADADWQWFPDAGNGVKTNGQNVTGNDPNDASVLVDSTFQQGWVQHIVNKWGTAANGGLRYYILDNEHSIWHGTHRDVHPTGASMDEIKQKMLDHAAKIKAIDPGAIVVGPEEWGWSGYLYSGLDQQTGAANGWSFFPDRSSHGGMDYLPWLLDQFKQNHQSTGKRLLDVFTVHYYPQGGEYSNTVTTAMQQRRNRSTRSLWDPNYVDETWIADKVKLIPRLKAWVDTYYPGTPVGITEYNWGAEGHINGATTLADVLGIFGREGLDMAAYWTNPGSSTPTYKAIKLYRNYDGAKSTFGDVSVSASGPNPDNVAVFAAQRTSDNKLTLMVISKYLTGTTPVTVNLQHFSPGSTAQAWQLTSSNAITRLADVSVAGGAIAATLPPQSITLFVVASAAPVSRRSDFGGDGKSDLLWYHASAGVLYEMPVDGFTAGAGAVVDVRSDLNWKVAAVADLDGDGRADVVWRHDVTGQVYGQLMNGGAIASQGTIYTEPNTAWRIAGAADVDGDGKADLVWKNETSGEVYVMKLNGLAVTSGQVVYAEPNLNWKIVALGDMNGDGRADILWRNQLTGDVFAMLMNGFTVLSGGVIYSEPNTNWKIVGLADFNGDGKADVLWQNTATGDVFQMQMNGTLVSAGQVFYNEPNTQWKIVALGDYNGDGRADVVWRNATSGQVYMMQMNGFAVSGSAFVYSEPDANWNIVGP